MGSLNLPGGLTSSQQALLARLSLLAAGGADQLTPARATALDSLDALTSSRASAANLAIVNAYVDELELRLTAARAGYLDTLLVHQEGTSALLDIVPHLAMPVVLVGGAAANVYGAWAQLSAALPGAQVLYGVYLVGDAVVAPYDVEVGEGAAGVEVTRGRFFWESVSTVNEGIYVPLPYPLRLTANARLAARCARNNAAGGTVKIKAHILSRPIL